MFRKNNSFLVRIPGISANSNEIYRLYNFQAFVNKYHEISDKFRKISGNIKFPENLQPYCQQQKM